MKLFKSIPLELKADATGTYQFEGYASTFGNVDLGGDVVVSGAFSKSLQKDPSVPILWQHCMSEPIGLSDLLRQDEKGLFIKYSLPKDDDFVKGRVMPQVKIGSVKEMSIGFWIDEYDYDPKTAVRYLKEISLIEVSLVTKAMNPQALITAFKSIDSIRDVEHYLKMQGMSSWEAKAMISKVKEFSGQRDAEEKSQRDAESVKSLFSEISGMKNLFSPQQITI